MGVEKFSVSFELGLGRAVRESAERAESSVSAWLAEAAQDRLRLEALGGAVSAWEERFGALTEEEVAAADRLLDAPPRRRARRRAG